VTADRKKGILVGISVGLGGCALELVTQIKSDSLFLALINSLWLILHFPLGLILVVLNPPLYLETFSMYLGVFVQWFLIGVFGYRIYKRRDLKRPNLS